MTTTNKPTHIKLAKTHGSSLGRSHAASQSEGVEGGANAPDKSADVINEKRQSSRKAGRKRSVSKLIARILSGWNLSFALKIAAAISLISIVAAMSLAYLGVSQHWQLLEQQGDAFGQTIVEQLAGSLVEPIFTDDHLGLQMQLNELAKKPAVYGTAVLYPSGKLMAQSGNVSLPWLDEYQRTELNASKDVMGIAFLRSKIPIGHYIDPVTLSGVNGAYVVVSLDRSPMSRVFNASVRDMVMAVLIICFISVLGSLLLSRMLSRPIYRLMAVSKAAREGRVQDFADMAYKSGMLDSREGESRDDEWGDILSIYTQLGHEVNSKREIEKLLQRFVASDVADELLSGKEVIQLGGDSVEASVLFVDIVEFTRMSEQMQPSEVAAMLNQYLSMFAACARIYNGSVDKFIGDAAMIVFGAPRADVDHRLHAMACAHTIQSVATGINEKRLTSGLPTITLRVGVNSGLMQAGILGSEFRMEYTVVGDAVNLASRLCDVAEPGQALVSEAVYNHGAYSEVGVSDAGTIKVKGKESSIRIYRIESVKDSKRWMVANLIEDIVSVN